MRNDLRAAVVTVSGRVAGGERDDVTGPALTGSLRASGIDVGERRVVADDLPALEALIAELAAHHDLVLLAGGVGIARSDHTPEAIERSCDRMIPGIGEAIRAACRDDVPEASLWRACAGVRERAVVVAIPGSPGAAEDAWDALAPVIPRAMQQVRGPGVVE